MRKESTLFKSRLVHCLLADRRVKWWGKDRYKYLEKCGTEHSGY